VTLAPPRDSNALKVPVDMVETVGTPTGRSGQPHVPWSYEHVDAAPHACPTWAVAAANVGGHVAGST
jgi:hypothetical protein